MFFACIHVCVPCACLYLVGQKIVLDHFCILCRGTFVRWVDWGLISSLSSWYICSRAWIAICVLPLKMHLTLSFHFSQRRPLDVDSFLSLCEVVEWAGLGIKAELLKWDAFCSWGFVLPHVPKVSWVPAFSGSAYEVSEDTWCSCFTISYTTFAWAHTPTHIYIYITHTSNS